MNLKEDLKKYKSREIIINTLLMQKRFIEDNDGIAGIEIKEKTGTSYKKSDSTADTALNNIDKIKILDRKINSLRFKQTRLKQYLQILNKEEYKIIELRYLNDKYLNWQEISSKIPCSYGTARSKFFKALDKLEALQEESLG